MSQRVTKYRPAWLAAGVIPGAIVVTAALSAPAFAASGASGAGSGEGDRPALMDVLPPKPKGMIDLTNMGLRPGEAEHNEQQDPLKYLAEDMTDIVNDLTSLRTDKPVQVKEGNVLAKLDKIIAMLDKQCSGGGSGQGQGQGQGQKPGNGGANPNPTTGMKDSTLTGGPGGIRELLTPKGGGKDWGSLPPKEREKITQSTTEGFPAGFEDVLSSYYHKLATEQAPTGGTGEGEKK